MPRYEREFDYFGKHFKSGDEGGSFLFRGSDDGDNNIEKIPRKIPRLIFRDWAKGIDFFPNTFGFGSSQNVNYNEHNNNNNVYNRIDEEAKTEIPEILQIDNGLDGYGTGSGTGIGIGTGASSGGSLSDEWLQQDQKLLITDSTVTFFLGSVLLFLAAVVLILSVVACQQIHRHYEIKNRLKSKKMKSIKNPGVGRGLYPVSIHTIDIPELKFARAQEAAEAANVKQTNSNAQFYDPFSF